MLMNGSIPRLVDIVTGLQWGDEGKGRIIDFLSEDAAVVIRYMGGNNAGHTVYVMDHDTGKFVKMVLHLLPSAIAKSKPVAIGGGVVVDPFALIHEVEYVKTFGFDPIGQLTIDPRASLVMVCDRVMDIALELARSKTGQAIGTTAKGIGPAYAAIANRTAIRVADLYHPDAFNRLLDERHAEAANLCRAMGLTREQWQQIFADLTKKECAANDHLIKAQLRSAGSFDYAQYAASDGSIGFNLQQLKANYQLAGARIKTWDCVRDVSELIKATIESGQRLLLEGAQGAMLDNRFGSWPNVTSSHPIAGGACVGLGIGPMLVDSVTGVTKAYTTRVGNGCFPSRITDPDVALWIQNKGQEFGATTGRPRDVGWFDVPVVRSACWWSSIDGIVITKLDILSGLKKINICVSYTIDGQEFKVIPGDYHHLNSPDLKPNYITLDGWNEDISNVRRWADLPVNAQRYLSTIVELVNESLPWRTRIKQISVGPNPDQCFFCD